VLIRSVAALVAGVALALTFEPVRAVYLLPVAVAAFVLCVRDLPVRRAWLPSLSYGVGFQFVLLWWMQAVGVDAWVSLGALEASFFLTLGPATVVLMRRRWWPVWVALAWVAVEVWRSSWPFGGMPWGRLAFASVDTPLALLLPYVGANGVSVLWALMGTMLAWVAIRTPWRRPAVGLAALVPVVALSSLPGLSPYSSAAEGTVTIAAVQGDVPGDGSDILLDHRQVTQNHVDATLALAADVEARRTPRPDFVLWPENSTAVDPFTDARINSAIWAAVRSIGMPILVGGMVDAATPTAVLNQGIVWDPVTGAGDRYTKRHPVPFGEYIPWRDRVFTANFGKLSLIPRDMVSGTRPRPLTVAGVRVADAICFDVAYDDGIREQIMNGAQVLVVQTSNATFIHTSQTAQQFAITRLRAIESHRSVAVAATNGVTGLILPDGTVQARAVPRTQDVLVAELPLSTEITPGIRLGRWIGWASVSLTALLLLAGMVRTQRKAVA